MKKVIIGNCKLFMTRLDLIPEDKRTRIVQVDRTVNKEQKVCLSLSEIQKVYELLGKFLKEVGDIHE